MRLQAVFLLGLLAGCASSGEPRYAIDLGGEQRFRFGDDPSFADPELDDSAWETVRVPGTWWPSSLDRARGWYRIRFELPSDVPTDRLAVDLGVVGWADEAFLNGVRIGGTGRFDRVPSVVPRRRVYAIPPELLRPGSNLLAVRVRGIPLLLTGMFASRIGIGDEAELERARAATAARTLAAEGVLFGFFACGWLLVGLFPKRGRAGRATVFLLASITVQMIELWLASNLARETGLVVEGTQFVWAAIGFAAVTNWMFVATIVRGSVPGPLVGVIVAGVAVALLLLLPLPFVTPLVWAAVAIGAAAGVVMLPMLVGAVRARTPGAAPIAVGSLLVGASALTTIFVDHPAVRPLGQGIIFYALAAQEACAIVALMRHAGEVERRAQHASEYALLAHGRERSRLARDLHDGLGQMLALLKLQLQRRQSVDEGIAHVDVTIDELRRIARDLRPAPLEDRAFGEAVREYAASLARRTNLAIEVIGDFTGPLADGVGDELYRIVQECLSNCFKHSGANHVTVELAEAGDRRVLTVTDDGRGLPDAPVAGMGLATIRERSEVLGGRCTIGRAPSGGTRIEVSVPR